MVKKIKKSNSGQAFLEYLLLIVVIVGLIKMVVDSDVFKEMMDPEIGLLSGVSKTMQFSYRHALGGNDAENYPDNYQTTNHKSFRTNDTRFFAPKEAYPNN